MTKVKNYQNPNMEITWGLHEKFQTKTKNFFLEEINKKQLIFLFAYLMLVSVLEVLAYSFHGAFSLVASRVWILGGLFCFLCIIYYFFTAIKDDIKEKKFIAVFGLLILLISLFSLLGNISYTEVNPDATQQLAAGVDSFKVPDWNYTGKAFLGYPNRQYVLSALPAVLFGRSIFTLQLGFSFPFFFGIVVLYCGIRKWAKRMEVNTIFSLIPLFSLFTFPFITEYFTNFEQSILPVSYTMILIGLLLIFLEKPNFISIIGISWFGCLLCDCYTPALASLALLLILMLIIGIAAIRNKELLPFDIKNGNLISKISGLMILNITIFLLATLITERQDRITQTRAGINYISTAYNSIYTFITDKNAVFMGMMGIIVLIYLVAGITHRLMRKDFIISIWILGVFCASFMLQGYTAYEPAWIMQRALIVIPVVVVAITLSLFYWIRDNNIKIRNDFLIVVLIAFSIIGYSNFQKVNQSFIYFNNIQPMKYMLSDLEKTTKSMNIKSTDEFTLIVYTDNILRRNPGDYLKFLYPEADVFALGQMNLPPNLDLNKTIIYSDLMPNKLEDIFHFELLTFTDYKRDNIVTFFKGIKR